MFMVFTKESENLALKRRDTLNSKMSLNDHFLINQTSSSINATKPPNTISPAISISGMYVKNIAIVNNNGDNIINTATRSTTPTIFRNFSISKLLSVQLQMCSIIKGAKFSAKAS